MTNAEIVAYVERHHKMPVNTFIDVDLGVPDPSRTTAKFVVTSATMSGGGKAQGHDEYPDGWRVHAMRLNDQDLFDPLGETIAFYMTGCFTIMIPPEEVQIVGHMPLQF